MNGPLVSEVRQSLSLFGLMALVMAAPVGLGLLAVRFLG